MTASHGYPRPQLERAEWTSLNGQWDFALDHDACWREPGEVPWDSTIAVPFAPETPASGIGNTDFYKACWYRRAFDAPSLEQGERVILHFGAVDHSATVWVNGTVAVRHEGGYTPFQADITRYLVHQGPQLLVVRAYDDPHDLEKPRGKQDWEREPHLIWYPRTTGIWQTVWFERVPSTSIRMLRWTSNLDRWEIGLEAQIDGEGRDEARLHVTLHVGEQLLADDSYACVRGEAHRRIALSDPGVDDYRNELLWSPISPTLIDAELELCNAQGDVIDRARSYTALRETAIRGDRFLLNDRPYRLQLVLDQGYWPESGLTAPNDDALRRDVELAKQMGFNGVRKHQKLEDPRYLYWAAKLGLLVWEEMPSAYRFTRRSIERTAREWTEAITRDLSHPCTSAWVSLNESSGVPDVSAIPAQRNYVQALYHLTKSLDPDRPVIGNDGWESVATDIIGIHDYDDDPDQLARRYETEEVIPNLFRREGLGGRLLTVEGHPYSGQPIVLSEFGGIGFSEDPAAWELEYPQARSPEELAQRYKRLLQAVRSLPVLAGFCYTQFADTYQETNGLLYADRRPKFPLEDIERATRGRRTFWEAQLERQWRQRREKAHRRKPAPASLASE